VVGIAVPASLAGRTFRAVANSVHGRIGADTVMRFTADDGVIVAGEYSGGAVVIGHVLASRIDGGRAMEMLYQSVGSGGELRAGRALASFTEDAGLRMHLDWRWLTPDTASGRSEWVAI
jgi:hypothetical protein